MQKKFLKNKAPNGATYSAVIYGACSKVGKAYAYFLAKQGFNLILVERDIEQLNALEVNLNTECLVPPKLVKIVLDRFDQDTLNKALVKPLSKYKDSPVKLFVNCKNSRRKPQSAASN